MFHLLAISAAAVETSTQKAGLWVGAGGMTLGALAIGGIGVGLARRHQHHAVASFFVCAIAAVLYLLMALGQGGVTVTGHSLVLGGGAAGGKFVYYARYIDWVLTTPLLLIGLIGVGLAGSRADDERRPGTAILAAAVGADVLMIVTGLFATLAIDNTHKYTWFAVSCVFFLIVVAILWGPVRAAARAAGGEVDGLFRRLLATLTGLWFLYPIIWILGTEGTGTLSLNAEVLVYAVVDLTAKVGFGLLLVAGIKGVTEGRSGRRAVPAGGLPASA